MEFLNQTMPYLLGGMAAWLTWVTKSLFEIRSDVRDNATKDDAQKELIESLGVEIKDMSHKLEALTLAMAAANIKVKV